MSSSAVGEVKIALTLDSSGLSGNAGAKLGSAFGNAWTIASGNLISSGLSMLMQTAVKVGKEIIATGMAYEKAMSEVKAISGATGEELDRLSEKALASARNTIYTSSEVASAYKYMAMAGWDVQDMLEGLDGILALAAASNLDLGRTSDIVTDALTAFGYTASQSGHFADVLARAATNANTNVDLMGESFKYVGAVAGAMQYSIEDVGVALGLMANAGIKASQAGTSLRSIISRMASPTKQVQKAMDELGISITNADGTVKPFSQVMTELRQKFSGLSETQKTQMASTIAGKNAMTGLLAIVNASDEDFENLTAAISDSDGAAQEMATTMKDNLAGDMTELNSKLDVMFVQLYEKIEPALRAVVQGLSGMVDGLVQVVSVAGDVVSAISQNEIAMGILNAAIKGIMAAMGGFIGVVNLVKTAIDNGRQAVETIGEKFSWLSGVVDAIKNTFSSFATSIAQTFNNVRTTITTTISNVWLAIQTWFTNMINGAVQMGSGFVNSIVQFFSQLPGNVSRIITSVLSAVKTWGQNMITTAKNAITNVVKTVVQTFGELPGKMLEIGKNIVEGLWNGINGATSWIKDKITSFASGVLDSIKNALGISSPSKVFRDEVGVFLAQGIGVGFTQEMGAVARGMQEALVSDFGLTVGANIPLTDIPEPEYKMSLASMAQTFSAGGEEDEEMETAPQPLYITLEMDGQQIQQVILQDIRRSS